MTFCLRTLFLWFLVSLAPAGSQTVPAPTSTAYTSSPAGSAWYGLVTLTLLVVLVAVVLRVFKRNAVGAVSEGGIRVLATKPLGPRESVVVVELQGRHFMLGHTPTQVNLIAELDGLNPSLLASASATPSSGLGSDFANALTSALKKK